MNKKKKYSVLFLILALILLVAYQNCSDINVAGRKIKNTITPANTLSDILFDDPQSVKLYGVTLENSSAEFISVNMWDQSEEVSVQLPFNHTGVNVFQSAVLKTDNPNVLRVFVGFALLQPSFSYIQKNILYEVNLGTRTSQVLRSDYIIPGFSNPLMIQRLKPAQCNSDNIEDFYYVYQVPGSANRFGVACLSGVDLSVISRLEVDARIADVLEDMNNDGVNEILTLIQNTAQDFRFSISDGQNGNIFLQIGAVGESIADVQFIPDLNGDRKRDFFFQSILPNNNGYGNFKVFKSNGASYSLVDETDILTYSGRRALFGRFFSEEKEFALASSDANFSNRLFNVFAFKNESFSNPAALARPELGASGLEASFPSQSQFMFQMIEALPDLNQDGRNEILVTPSSVFDKTFYIFDVKNNRIIKRIDTSRTVQSWHLKR